MERVLQVRGAESTLFIASKIEALLSLPSARERFQNKMAFASIEIMSKHLIYFPRLFLTKGLVKKKH